MATTKQVFMVCSAHPQQGYLAREALDATFAFAAFEQKVSVLFSGAGVWQVAKKALANPLTNKTISQSWQAAELYDIDKLYVNAADLAQHNLTADDLLPSIDVLSHEDVSQVMATADAIVSM